MSNEIHGSSIVEASQPSAEIELPYKYVICFDEFSSDFTLSALFATSEHIRSFDLTVHRSNVSTNILFAWLVFITTKKKRLSGFRHLIERIAGNNLPPKSASWFPISVPGRKKSM